MGGPSTGRTVPLAIQEAWQRYKLHGDTEARDRIINQYAYLVKITAGRVVTSLPPSLEREDLVGAGAMGLVKAVDQFDPKRQVKFETYAIALIRGAILEMLREEDWVPRSIREKTKNLERTLLNLEVRLGRHATEDEVAEELGLTLDEYHQLLNEASRTAVLSLDDTLSADNNDKIRLLDIVADDSASPVQEVEGRERLQKLSQAIDRLPDRERLVIALYYYEGLTFKEIGKVLGVSESRVYQLHTQAVGRIRGYLSRDTELFRISR